ncbi:hypothetical protein ERN12_07985 [Rhodobacteraceae bacterium]|nr:hypothetical protein ERN12_07985 [Paracoccaceae bacterium]
MLRKSALGLMAVVIVACYAVPFLWIGDTPRWTGSFLFWCLAGVAVIVLNAAAMAGFREDKQ